MEKRDLKHIIFLTLWSEHGALHVSLAMGTKALILCDSMWPDDGTRVSWQVASEWTGGSGEWGSL